MNRIIKFRAFNENKEMVYYDFLMTEDVRRFAKDIWYHKDLMQFTGLTDKNGKEIYEGDVVRILSGATYEVCWADNKSDTSYPHAEFHLRGITYTDGRFADARNFCKGIWEATGADTCMGEIIGNIYENPLI